MQNLRPHSRPDESEPALWQDIQALHMHTVWEVLQVRDMFENDDCTLIGGGRRWKRQNTVDQHVEWKQLEGVEALWTDLEMLALHAKKLNEKEYNSFYTNLKHIFGRTNKNKN